MDEEALGWALTLGMRMSPYHFPLLCSLALSSAVLLGEFAGNIGTLHAQESCPAIAFQGDVSTIDATASPEESLCYRLDARAGDRIALKVLRGNNTVFAIAGVTDAQDRFTFTAEEKEYRNAVGQMLRTVRPQAFRISITRVNSKAAAAPSPSRPWPVFVSHDPDRVSTQQRSAARGAMLTLTCNKALGPGTGASLYDYRGNALDRTDDVSRPATLLVSKAGSQPASFKTRIHYVSSDKAWVLSDDLPVGFLQALPAGETLVLQNGSGERVVDFDLKNIEGFSRAALELCAGMAAPPPAQSVQNPSPPASVPSLPTSKDPSPAVAAPVAQPPSVGGAFAALAPELQTKIAGEANEMEKACMESAIYAAFHDCQCLKARFLEKRSQQLEKSKLNVNFAIRKECVNPSGMATYNYEYCFKTASRMTARDYSDERRGAYCKCFAQEVAKQYSASPDPSYRYISDVQSRALSNCSGR